MNSLDDAVEIRALSSGLQVPPGLFGVYGVDQSNGVILSLESKWALADDRVFALFDDLELAAQFASEVSKNPSSIEATAWYVKGEKLKLHFEFHCGELVK